MWRRAQGLDDIRFRRWHLALLGMILGFALIALPACSNPRTSARNATPQPSADGAAILETPTTVILTSTPVVIPTWTTVPAIHTTATPRPTVPPPPTPTTVSSPKTLEIPAIGLKAPIVPIGLAADGQMEAPNGPDIVGWYRYGPKPGESGNSLMTGHLDWKTQTAVFWRLRELQPGAWLIVSLEDGTKRQYIVEEVVSYPKEKAPIDRVFGFAIGSVITIITCDGKFDQDLHDYDRRLIVRARSE